MDEDLPSWSLGKKAPVERGKLSYGPEEDTAYEDDMG